VPLVVKFGYFQTNHYKVNLPQNVMLRNIACLPYWVFFFKVKVREHEDSLVLGKLIVGFTPDKHSSIIISLCNQRPKNTKSSRKQRFIHSSQKSKYRTQKLYIKFGSGNAAANIQ